MSALLQAAFRGRAKQFPFYAAVVELADTRDLKSRGVKSVPVRARSAAPRKRERSRPVSLLFSVTTCQAGSRRKQTGPRHGSFLNHAAGRIQADISAFLPRSPRCETVLHFSLLQNVQFLHFIHRRSENRMKMLPHQPLHFSSETLFFSHTAEKSASAKRARSSYDKGQKRICR